MRSFHFSSNRLLATAEMANRFPWEKTVEQWRSELQLFRTLDEEVATVRAKLRGATGTLDLYLDELQAAVRTAVQLGRVRFRHDPVKLALFDALRTDAESRAEKPGEAEALRNAWKKCDPAWEPLPGQTLVNLEAVLLSFQPLMRDHSEKETAAREARQQRAALARRVHADCVAWYAVATRLFPAGTNDGDTIRSHIPTTTTRGRPAVGKAEFLNVMMQGGTVHFDVAAERATLFTLLYQGPEDTEFAALATKTRERSFTKTGLAPGLHRFKVQPRNVRQKGIESEVLEVMVTKEAVTAV